MKQYILNINLNTNSSANLVEGEVITPKHALQAIKSAFLDVEYSKTVATEDGFVLVAQVGDKLSIGDSDIQVQIEELCTELMQDSIKWFDVDRQMVLETGAETKEIDRKHFLIV